MHFCHFREFRSVIQAKNYPKTPNIFRGASRPPSPPLGASLQMEPPFQKKLATPLEDDVKEFEIY